MTQETDFRIEGGGERSKFTAAFDFDIEQAGAVDGGEFRITGTMSAFRVMHSGRLLHPAPFARWLKQNPRATLPMLANHGQVDSPFATIGLWDRFELLPKSAGMRWSGYVASGVPIADQARTLLAQRVLRQLSLGWDARRATTMRRNDRELDPFVLGALDAAERDEAYVFTDWAPFEGSVVDVADDPGARLAARAGGTVTDAQLAPLREEIKQLRAEIARLATGAGSPEARVLRASLDEVLKEFIEQFKEAALELLSSDEAVIDMAEAYRQDQRDERADADAAEGGAVASVRERLARFTGKGERA